MQSRHHVVSWLGSGWMTSGGWVIHPLIRSHRCAIVRRANIGSHDTRRSAAVAQQAARYGTGLVTVLEDRLAVDHHGLIGEIQRRFLVAQVLV